MSNSSSPSVTPVAATPPDLDSAKAALESSGDQNSAKASDGNLASNPADDATGEVTEAAAEESTRLQSSLNGHSAGEEVEEEEELTSPLEIDTRRAQHSVARARQLAERGELPAAILSCRQAIALVSNLFEAHALLGDLLERAGDRKAAMTAYEKALQIRPESTFERNALERLREQESSAGALFVFNDTELFDDSTPTPRIEARLPPAESVPAVTPASSVASIPASQNVAELPWSEPEEVAAAPTSEGHSSDRLEQPSASNQSPARGVNSATSATSVSTPNPEPRLVDSVAHSGAGEVTPVAGPAASAVATAPVTAPDSPSTPVNFRFEPSAPAPEPLWARYLRAPSLYTRTLPVVAVALLGMGTLLWARSRAVDVVPVEPTVVVQADDVVITPNDAVIEPSVVPNPNPVPQSAPQGFPISNQPPATVVGAPGTTSATTGAPGSSTATVRRATSTSGATRPNTARPNTAGSSPRVASRPVPRFPTSSSGTRPGSATRPSLPPAAVNTGSNQADAAPLVLPRPRVSLPAPGNAEEPPVRALPPAGGAPLNPSGSADRGYIRVREGRVGTGVLPARPDNQAREDERAANAAARSGQTDAAISRLSAAISADPDDGFRFQQRAMLFMERGDYRRAADDFQSAISSYQNQIDRGEQVAQARAGLRAARSGLNLALSRSR